ncbi:MAG: hypothetical protein OXI93_08560 [Bryobacterales bacterium]|nr:hypothetical protein [Bryobacterales bacterium]
MQGNSGKCREMVGREAATFRRERRFGRRFLVAPALRTQGESNGNKGRDPYFVIRVS